MYNPEIQRNTDLIKLKRMKENIGYNNSEFAIQILKKGFIVGTEGGAGDTCFVCFVSHSWGWGLKDVCLCFCLFVAK